jgi:hypothetical protein
VFGKQAFTSELCALPDFGVLSPFLYSKRNGTDVTFVKPAAVILIALVSPCFYSMDDA